ncbi:phosphatidate cytidylyltransferase [Sodalis sp. CWE]|uniref:phosphatidate cytidylyltransferase n=1 Tax=Sodalis sp. CWE TaxID=2803816 RepID=UPI001C7CFCD1|nr:phosphatidate cytidylyltransferase [Sodalis sp. CWE]MBX4180874.1 phosphatidate cytidylyltransferase [Sodalis sp. CWE]
MIKQRIVTSFLLIPIVIFLLFSLSLTGFSLITLAICMLSAWEWGKLAGLNSNSHKIFLTILYGIFLTLLMIFMTSTHSSFLVWRINFISLTILFWWFIIVFCLILSYPYSSTIWRTSILLRLIFGFLTISPFFWGMLILRYHHYSTNSFIGAWWILYVMVLVWSTDTGAYIFGRTLGYYRLAPKISPKKTWEGFIGGLITSATVSWLFGIYAPLESKSTVALIVSSIATVLASVLGDLIESMLKREVKIKDSSRLIPGHGGILDCIDSLIAALPIFTCFMLKIFQSI